MTKIGTPLTRETAAIDYRKNAPIVVTLEPRVIRFRVKGCRDSYTLRYEEAVLLAVRARVLA
jgi:hypothetical protein